MTFRELFSRIRYQPLDNQIFGRSQDIVKRLALPPACLLGELVEEAGEVE